VIGAVISTYRKDHLPIPEYDVGFIPEYDVGFIPEYDVGFAPSRLPRPQVGMREEGLDLQCAA
jgi:hypothetical protein